MSNDVNRGDPTARQWSARLTLLMCLGVLAVLVTQLPRPTQVVQALTGSSPSPTTPPLAAMQSVLLMAAGLIAWLIVGWAVAVIVVGLLARLPGRSGRGARLLLPRIAPASVGRMVAAAVGVSLMAGTAACAAPGVPGSSPTAVTSPTPTTVSAGQQVGDGDPQMSITIDWPDPSTSPAPKPTPDPPLPDPPLPDPPLPDPPGPDLPDPESAPATPPVTGAAAAAQADPVESVAVQPGDSLWRIAAHTLGPDADDADIDTAWRAWYFTNRQVIGDDPDLIVPGQSLVPPAPAEQVRS